MRAPGEDRSSGAGGLRLAAITKRFGAQTVLNGVDLDLAPGGIHALVGENGAGKSTLIRILGGVIPPDSGEVLLDGVPVPGLTPARAQALGIAIVHQQPALFLELSVAENLALGDEGPFVSGRARARRARALLDRAGAAIDPAARAGDLSVPERQLVGIARALRHDPRVLVLDEPTAALPEPDVRRLHRSLADLCRAGAAILYVSHRIDDLLPLADRFTVLRDGRRVATGPRSAFDRETLVRAMVGREPPSAPPAAARAAGEVLLDVVMAASAAVGLRGASLELRAGEIAGIFGLVGAGRTGLLRVLAGLEPLDSGSVRIAGRNGPARGVAEALRRGVALVPEDRLRQGLVAGLSLAGNVTLPRLAAFTRRGLLDRRAEARAAAEAIGLFDIRGGGPETDVSRLSGGNQQKVAIARWVLAGSRILLLDEPTAGIDVLAREAVHRLLRGLADEGRAILIASSDLQELLAVADRILVMRGGRLGRDAVARDPEAILRAALGEAVA